MHRSLTPAALLAAVALISLTGCSRGTEAISPDAYGRIRAQTASRLAKPNVDGIGPPFTCPPAIARRPTAGRENGWISRRIRSSDRLLYVSQFCLSGVQIYDQAGTNQSPIGFIYKDLSQPLGMTVTPNGDLYVANLDGQSISIFKKGQLTRYKALWDPHEYPIDVAVDTDGTVYVANFRDVYDKPGSISVYAPGAIYPTSNLAIPNNYYVLNDALDKDGRLYVNYLDGPNGLGAMVKFYRFKPTSRRVSAHLTAVTFGVPGGMQFDRGRALIAADRRARYVAVYDTPSTGVPSFTFASDNLDPSGLALTSDEHQIYVADSVGGVVHRYSYPGGIENDTILNGLSVGNPPCGVATDPAAPL